jgi:hypothetical protein
MLKADIEQIDLESVVGKIRDVESEEYLSWVRLDTIKLLKIKVRTKNYY